jgi:hypothetical protein
MSRTMCERSYLCFRPGLPLGVGAHYGDHKYRRHGQSKQDRPGAWVRSSLVDLAATCNTTFDNYPERIVNPAYCQPSTNKLQSLGMPVSINFAARFCSKAPQMVLVTRLVGSQYHWSIWSTLTTCDLVLDAAATAASAATIWPSVMRAGGL